MKQLLFLLLFPCLAMAQYTGNGNQKITLGEQTTADGLVWRGRLADTANLLTNKLDTSVYIVLDTGTRAMWYYRASTTPKWTRLVDSLNNLQGTLSIAKGGTGSGTQNFVDLTTTQNSIGGAKTFTSAVTGARFNPTENTKTGTGMYLPATNTLGFSTDGTNRLFISSLGNLSTDSISKTTATYKTFEIGKGSGTTILSGRLDGLNDFLIGLNFYYDGGSNLKYIGNGYSSYYQQNDGNHRFFKSSSGSANANITFTESMRITENGSLRIYGNNQPLVVSSNNATTLYTTYQYNTNTDVGYVGNGVGTVTGGAASDFGISAATGNLLIAAGGVTERMRITSGGNVGIGQSIPTARLHVKGNGTQTGEAFKIENNGGTNLLTVLDNGSMTLNTPLAVANGGTGNTSLDAADIVTKSGTQTIGGAKTFTSAVTGASFRPTSPTIPTNGIYLPNANTLGFSTNGTNKMTLNSGGNIGIGIVPNSDWNTGYTVLQTNYATYASENARIGQALFVFNAYNTDPADAAAWKRVYGNNAGMYEQSSGNHKWYTASSGAANSAISWVEGMTLSSNAGLSVGTATAAPANGIVSNGEVWIGYTSDNGAYPLQVNGQIFATNATIATSDEKYKENITPLNKGLEIVNKLKPVTFNFISDTENNFSQYEEVGFIAQDVDRALSTESFSKSIVKAADDSEPTSTMGLATQNLIPILVKAIQEQNALIKALEQRILTLENK